MTARQTLEELRLHWRHGAVSPPLRPDMAVLSEELDEQIAALGAPGARQHFLIHGEDAVAARRLGSALADRVARNFEDVQVIRLSHQVRLLDSAAGFFELLVSQVTGSFFSPHVSASIANLAGAALKRVIDDSVGRFLARLQAGTEHGAERRGALVYIEDYDALLEASFATPEKESYLRAFLQDASRVIFLVVSEGARLDSDPDGRIFRLFRRWDIALPTPEDMLDGAPPETSPLAALHAVASLFSGYERPFVSSLHQVDAGDDLDLSALSTSLVDLARADQEILIRAQSQTRLSILQALASGAEPATATDIARRLSVPQSRIARAILELREAGLLVADQSSGRSVPLSIRPRSLALALRDDPRELETALGVCVGALMFASAIRGRLRDLARLDRRARHRFLLSPSLLEGPPSPACGAGVNAWRASLAAGVAMLHATQFPEDIGDIDDMLEAHAAERAHMQAASRLALDGGRTPEQRRTLDVLRPLLPEDDAAGGAGTVA